MSEPTEKHLHNAAAMLGRKGGKSGTGDSKRRSKEAIAKAVKARIKANRERKKLATAQ